MALFVEIARRGKHTVTDAGQRRVPLAVFDCDGGGDEPGDAHGEFRRPSVDGCAGSGDPRTTRGTVRLQIAKCKFQIANWRIACSTIPSPAWSAVLGFGDFWLLNIAPRRRAGWWRSGSSRF